MDTRLTSVIAYLTWIGWIIAFALGHDDREARFYLNQALVLHLANIIVGIALGLIKIILVQVLGLSLIMSVISAIASIVLVVLWLIGFIRAINQDSEPLPIIGEITIIK